MLVNYQGYKCGMWVKGSRGRVVQAEPVLVQRDFLRIFFSPSQVCLSRMCIILCFNVQTKEMGKKVKPCLQRRIQKYILGMLNITVIGNPKLDTSKSEI